MGLATSQAAELSAARSQFAAAMAAAAEARSELEAAAAEAAARAQGLEAELGLAAAAQGEAEAKLEVAHEALGKLRKKESREKEERAARQVSALCNGALQRRRHTWRQLAQLPVP